jgi:hypothetical protein
MSQYFYDGQIRRYLTQIVRAFSNFSYQDADGDLRVVPVMYGDITRQVASIIRDNSENKLPSAPRMGVYMTGLQMDRSRLSDSSFVSKINLREREFNNLTGEYGTQQAKGYTVERLHPTPYTLSINIDLWSTSTDQKLQILEQILMLFNPDLEFQTTDNYIDWTSLSLLQLENMNISSRTIPMGTESEIDVATLSFTAPIYISPPVKVKKLGIITDIITGIFNQGAGTISLEGFNPPTDGKAWSANNVTVLPDGTVVNQDSVAITSTVTSSNGTLDLSNPIVTSYRNFDITVQNNVAKLVINKKLRLGEINWLNVLEAESPAKFQNGISQIRLYRAELGTPIIGTFSINNDKFELTIDYDIDTLPSDTVIQGPARNNGSIDFVINPIKWNPTNFKNIGVRALLTGPIGGKVERKFTQTEKTSRIDTEVNFDVIYGHQVFVDGVPVATTSRNIDDLYVIDFATAIDLDSVIRYELYLNEDGADAWKNNNGTDFVADQNDIVEWDGSRWHIVFDASEINATTYVTNLTTNQQLYWNNFYWQASVDGYYPRGTWDLLL